MNVLCPLASPKEARKNHCIGFRQAVVPTDPRLCAPVKRRRRKRCPEALPDLGPALACWLLYVRELLEKHGKSHHEKKHENRKHVHAKSHAIRHVDHGATVLRIRPKTNCIRGAPQQVHVQALLAAELSHQIWAEPAPCSKRADDLHASAESHRTLCTIWFQGRSGPSS